MWRVLKSANLDQTQCVWETAAGLGLHFLHMSEGPFSHDARYLDFTLSTLNKMASVMQNVTPNI